MYSAAGMRDTTLTRRRTRCSECAPIFLRELLVLLAFVSSWDSSIAFSLYTASSAGQLVAPSMGRLGVTPSSHHWQHPPSRRRKDVRQRNQRDQQDRAAQSAKGASILTLRVSFSASSERSSSERLRFSHDDHSFVSSREREDSITARRSVNDCGRDRYSQRSRLLCSGSSSPSPSPSSTSSSSSVEEEPPGGSKTASVPLPQRAAPPLAPVDNFSVESSHNGKHHTHVANTQALSQDSREEGTRGLHYTEAISVPSREVDGSVVGVSKEESGNAVFLRQLSVTLALVAVVAVAFDYEHGMEGFHWFRDWAGGAAPRFPSRSVRDAATSGGGIVVGAVHLTPLKSMATGLGAGFTRAVSRTLTFPLDTLKTRSQVSGLRDEDRAALPEEMRRLLDGPPSFKGVFKGFSAFLAQAGPANAVFFVVYDALNSIGGATLLTATATSASGGDAGVGGALLVPLLPTALHLAASSLATVPANLVRTPAEVVKQRLQVGQESGNALEAFSSIVEAEGMRGLFVGGKEQLIREIPFNAIQFTVYEFLKSSGGSSELWADAALGAASSAVAAIGTQPVDTVKTRVMTKSVPGKVGGKSPGFLKAAALVAEAEGASSLFLGLLPRLVLVSTGGAFYFWGQAFVALLLK